MDYFGKKLLGIIGIKKAYMENRKVDEIHDGNFEEPKKRQRYSGIPTIPADIGYNSGKAPGGSRSTGVLSNFSSNPAVILGMGLTTLALLGMIRRSVMGDKQGTQKYMRYRIFAQFFTVSALVAGVTIFATTAAVAPASQKENEKPIIIVSPNSSN
uniref:HIG1 domain-containing protein n=1 Tax=Panagrolaimus superbus TaxID=310955 RepID=A0A914ZBU4_9BILA